MRLNIMYSTNSESQKKLSNIKIYLTSYNDKLYL